MLLKNAAEEMREQLLIEAAEMLGSQPDKIVFNGRDFSSEQGDTIS